MLHLIERLQERGEATALLTATSGYLLFLLVILALAEQVGLVNYDPL